MQLLGGVSSHLRDMSVSFESTSRRWQCFHREQRQQEPLRGATGSLHCNNLQRLVDMWLAYQLIALFRGNDGDVAWDLSSSVPYHKSLTAYVSYHRSGHISSVTSHFDLCVGCGSSASLKTDGNILATADNDALFGFHRTSESCLNEWLRGGCCGTLRERTYRDIEGRHL